MIRCANCGNSNDYTSIRRTAISKTVATIQDDVCNEVKKIFNNIIRRNTVVNQENKFYDLASTLKNEYVVKVRGTVVERENKRDFFICYPHLK